MPEGSTRLVIDGKEYKGSAQFLVPHEAMGEVIAVVGDDEYRICLVEGEDQADCVVAWDMAMMNSGLAWYPAYLDPDATRYDTDSLEIESIVLEGFNVVIEDPASIAEMTALYRDAAAGVVTEANPAVVEYWYEHGGGEPIQLHFSNHKGLFHQVDFITIEGQGSFFGFAFGPVPSSSDQTRTRVVPVADNFLSLSTYFKDSES
jgi:hypothetical protein